MTNRLRVLPQAATIVAAVVMIGLSAGNREVGAKESPATDCLISFNGSDSSPLPAIVTCKDCDPSCDQDASNSTPNGQCTFAVRACVNDTATGCTTRALKSAKVNPKKALVSVTPNGVTRVCGTPASVIVKTKKKGKKAGKLRLTGLARTSDKPRAGDRDVLMLVCEPRPAGESCPTTSTTTTTVTTTSTTTTTTLPSACEGGAPNGNVQGNEQCDDGNLNPADGCTNDCTTCGAANPVVTAPEQCDDGNLVNGDGCDATCRTTGCGSGVVTGAETCDPLAVPTGCGQGETCMPAGTISECTCKVCADITPAKTLTFTTGANVATFCGDQGFNTAATGTTTGKITAETSDEFLLGAGCLYIGGGNASVPGGAVPDGSLTKYDALQQCDGGEVILSRSARTTSPDNSLTCTQGAGPGKVCINDLATWPNLASCNADTDCRATGGNGSTATLSCVDKPNCMFGAPLPIENGGLSTCVINTFGENSSGSVIDTTGETRLSIPLRAHTFLKGTNDTFPCPRCMNGTCDAGARVGQSCSGGVGSQLTTIECPPAADNGSYLPEFIVSLTPLTTGVTMKTASDGNFCPSQQTFSAFGTQFFRSPPLKIVEIQQTGVPAGDLTSGSAAGVTLGSVFCIPQTGDALIDGAADLPGPGAVSLPGTLQLQ
jgi:cysteine-rich repeat protein